jgi:Uma2 family endonuclease
MVATAMDQALRRPMTLDEFLAWERRQDLRYEFDGFEPIAMTGGTLGHSAIASNLDFALRHRLRGSPCRAFRGDVKIVVADHVRYPDAVVTCSPAPPTTEIVPEPVVVFEVLSASTARTDRTVKNAEYRATASIQHYVMLEQSVAAATVFTRAGEDWIGRLVTGIDAVLDLPALNIRVPLGEIYAGIELSEGDGDDD